MYCKEMLTEIEETKNKQKTKICPFCKNEIKFEAKKCQYCQEFLNDTKEIKENTEENETKNEDTPIIDDFSKYKET